MSTDTQIAVPTGTWSADPVHSNATFSARHMVVSTYKGSFNEFAATLTTSDDGRLALDGTIAAASIVTRDENLTGHLLSPEFLDAEAYPTLRFVTTEIRRDGNEIEAPGEITVKGITRPVVATGRISDATDDPWGNTRLGVELTTTVDRREFDMNWNTPLPSGGIALGYDIEVTLDLEFVKDKS